MAALVIILAYLSLLLVLGLVSNRTLRGTASDYFLASRSIGSFLLLMSLFGTTMTAFALIGSTGESFKSGIGVFGKMASWSGIVHSACFFLVGIKLWSFGKRYGYTTRNPGDPAPGFLVVGRLGHAGSGLHTHRPGVSRLRIGGGGIAVGTGSEVLLARRRRIR